MQLVALPWVSNDLWEIIFSFCTRASKKQLVCSCRAFFTFIFQLDSEYTLDYSIYALLNRENTYGGSIFDFICKTLPKHYFLPPQKFIQQNGHTLFSRIRIHENYWEIPELQEYEYEPSQHRVMPWILKHVTHYYKQEEAVILEMMKYLPWDAKALLDHPYPNVAKMAHVGVQLANLTLEEARKVAQPLEDYAMCCMYDPETERNAYPLFGHKWVAYITDEQVLLTCLRAQSIHWQSPLPFKVSNMECIKHLLHKKIRFESIHESLLEDLQFVKTVILQEPSILARAPDSIRNNEALMRYTIQHSKPQVLLYASLQMQQLFCARFIQVVANEKLSAVATLIDKFWYDHEPFMRTMLSKDGQYYKHASLRIKNMELMIYLALENNPKVYEHLPDEWKCDMKIISTAIPKHLELIIHVPPHVVKQNSKFQAILDAHARFKRNMYKKRVSMEYFVKKEKIYLDLKF